MKLLGFLFGLGLLFLPSLVEAQVIINLQTGRMTWEYTQGTEPATEFRMKCGPSADTYNRVTTISDVATKSILIRSVIGGSGIYYCRIYAANKFGESQGSNEVFFEGGAEPSTSPTNLAPLAK